MTDRELWQAAWKELTLTTDPYPTWKKKGFPASSHWAKAKALGDQIGVPPLPPPPPPPTDPNTLEIVAGTYTSNVFAALVDGHPAATRVKPVTAGTVVVTGSYAPRNGLTVEGIVFDGLKVTANIWLTDRVGWTYRNCTFRNYFVEADSSSHSEALYVGGGCKDGLVDGCTFDNNGTTAHIFFTWFGGTPDPYDQNNYPRDICVRNSRFANGKNPYFAIQWRPEIPDGACDVDPSCVFVGPQSQRPARACT